MSDSYLSFVNKPFGKAVARNLGLPAPINLERYKAGAPLVEGLVVLGGNAKSQMLASLASLFTKARLSVQSHQSLPQWVPLANAAGLVTGRVEPEGVKAKVLIFDATGIEEIGQTQELFQFFHDLARSVTPCGRVLIIGRSPESCKNPRMATVQRGLEGLTRSLGKELKKGIAANLLYVNEGCEDAAESSIRFLISARAAYVSGQVVRVTQTSSATIADWSKPLAGQVALVTGASRGIGESIAHTLARDGAKVICLDIPQLADDLKAVARQIAGEDLAVDITADDAPQQIAEKGLELGGFDIVVHNAGITRDKTIAKMSDAQWNMVMDINLGSEERINDELLAKKALKNGARIVCVSSISGIAGNLGQTNYALSKASVIGMVQAMAPVLKQQGITINAVAPGFIETQMTAKIPLGIREAGRRMNSMSQGGQPVDVAEAIAWLSAATSSGLSGNIVRVCGQSLIGA